MTLIDFGDIKIRFDPKEVRINIDGDLIDIGARRDEAFPELNEGAMIHPPWKLDEEAAKRMLGRK
jgi:hypothetical protein